MTRAASESAEAEVRHLLGRVAEWAPGRRDLQAVALVGSWARGAARAESDVDLVLLTDDPALYTERDGWISELGGQALVRTKSWGAITERRFKLPGGLEVEVGVGRPSWASAAPLDAGTRRVAHDGLRALYDPKGLLGLLLAVCADQGLQAGMVAETDRVIVRPWRVEEADRFYDMHRRWEVARWISGRAMESHEEASALIQTYLDRLVRDPRFGAWAVVERSSGIPDGTVLLKPLPDGAGEVEIGWHLHPDAWGRRPRRLARCWRTPGISGCRRSGL